MTTQDKDFINSFQWFLIFSLLIFLAEYPDKPKCIKYVCSKYPWIKWFFIFGWLYGRQHYIFIFITIFVVYHILYSLDDYLYENYENFKECKDKSSK